MSLFNLVLNLRPDHRRINLSMDEMSLEVRAGMADCQAHQRKIIEYREEQSDDWFGRREDGFKRHGEALSVESGTL